MSINCKWDNYCSIKKQGAKATCLENQKQQRLFEEQFINLQFDGLIEQANVQYQICVEQCGGCQFCPCVNECSLIKEQSIAAINQFRQQQLDQIKEKYECCDETFCETQSNYFYEWCCQNNGPLAGDLRNSSGSWLSLNNPIFEPPIGDRSRETQAFYTNIPTIQELFSPDDIAVTRAEEKSRSDVSELIDQTTARDWDQYARRIRLCINLMIRTHHNCVQAELTKWKTEDNRITETHKQDLVVCDDQYWLCRNGGTTSEQECKNRRAACEESANKKRDAARKTNDDRYKGVTGRDIPPKRGTDQPIPNIKPPYKNPPCLCCQISDDAYARCRERAWQGDSKPDREPTDRGPGTDRK
jgi:hypothetical protein